MAPQAHDTARQRTAPRAARMHTQALTSPHTISVNHPPLADYWPSGLNGGPLLLAIGCCLLLASVIQLLGFAWRLVCLVPAWHTVVIVRPAQPRHWCRVGCVRGVSYNADVCGDRWRSRAATSWRLGWAVSCGAASGADVVGATTRTKQARQVASQKQRAAQGQRHQRSTTRPSDSQDAQATSTRTKQSTPFIPRTSRSQCAQTHAH